MSILVLAEHNNTNVKSATLNVVSAAAKIGDDVHVLVAGADCGAAGEAAAKISGVAKVLLCDDPLYANHLVEPLAALLQGLATNYTHILGASTSTGKSVMPRLAALLDVAQISDLMDVVSEDTFVRPIYAGNAIATVQSADPIKIFTVRGPAFPKAAAEGGSAAVETIDAAGDPGLSSFVSREESKSERPELTAARVIISGGRGMQSGDNFKILEEVADKLGC